MLKLISLLFLSAIAGAASLDDRFIELRNNQPLRSVDAAGTGFVSLVKSTATNAPVVGASSTIAVSFDFGDASDGDAVLDGVNTFSWASLSGSTYTMLRPVFLHNLTINSGKILSPAYYSIWGTGTLTNNGVIDASGTDGATEDSPGIGCVTSGAPVIYPVGYLTQVDWGYQAGMGNTTAGGDGGINATPANPGGTGNLAYYFAGPNSGGAGGLGGNGTSNNGEAGGATQTPTTPFYVHRWLIAQLGGGPLWGAPGGGVQGAGGGGGGGDATHAGGGGACGGSGGGAFGIFFDTLNNLGSIQANGGGGGVGGSPSLGNTGGGGGGGGGRGGLIMIVNNTVTAAGTIAAAPGSAGNGGTHHGTGTDGAAGVDGQSGVKIHYVISTGTYL